MKIWQLFNQLDPDVTALKVIYASSNGHPLKIHFSLRVFLAFLGCTKTTFACLLNCKSRYKSIFVLKNQKCQITEPSKPPPNVVLLLNLL
jgi:hypothetical protein